MKKILVIDDEELIRDLILEMLTESNYQCMSVTNGVEGIVTVQEYFPDLIICDINMPEMNGYEVIQKLQENPAIANIPFIFLSGNTSSDDIRKGMNVGADDYLLKPFKKEELLLAIESRLNKREKLELYHKAEFKNFKEKLSKDIHYDVLTGLPKLSILPQLFKEIMKRNVNGRGIGVLILSIDRFEFFREAFGRTAIKAIVKVFVERLQSIFSEEYMLFSEGMNKFVIIVYNLLNKEMLEDIAQRILDELKITLKYENYELNINSSIGYGFNKLLDKNDFKNTLEEAEIALYNIQNDGGNECQMYHPDMKKKACALVEIESDLFHAQKNEELRVFYQPQVDIHTGKIIGMEALIRWVHPTIGVISPLQFIPIAEENGLILDIGKWVLTEACQKMKEWSEVNPSLRLAVNISVKQFQSGRLCEEIRDILKKTGVLFDSLELEVTESIFIKDVDFTIQQMKDLDQSKVRIAIDDFGTGYSSLSYLKKFPLHTLKIDRSFVNDITKSVASKEIVVAIIEMAKTLHLEVLAEGVETEQQLQCLKDLGVNKYQGYFFSKPLPEEEFLKLLEKQQKEEK